MALWECRDCTTAYSVGAPTCPHCGSTDYREQGEGGEGMGKITVQGGATIAGAHVVGGEWSDGKPDESPAEGAAVEVSVSVDGVDQGPGEVAEPLGGPFKPLPEPVEHVSTPDYGEWTVEDLRAELAGRGLPTGGRKAELIERLRDADTEGSSG